MDVSDGGAKLIIRTIPRINLAALALPKEARARGFRANAGPRPPQRYFDRSEVLEAIRSAEASSGASDSSLQVEARTMPRLHLRCDVFGGHFYRDGMEYREVKSTLVTPFGPQPSLDELAKFRARDGSGGKGDGDDEDGEGEDGKRGAGAGALKSAEDALLESIGAAVASRAGRGGDNGSGEGDGSTPDLLPGDSVVVVRGDLRNLTGRVVALNPGGTFTLQPSAESAAQLGLNERLELALNEVMKVFNIVSGGLSSERRFLVGLPPYSGGHPVLPVASLARHPAHLANIPNPRAPPICSYPPRHLPAGRPRQGAGRPVRRRDGDGAASAARAGCGGL